MRKANIPDSHDGQSEYYNSDRLTTLNWTTFAGFHCWSTFDMENKENLDGNTYQQQWIYLFVTWRQQRNPVLEQSVEHERTTGLRRNAEFEEVYTVYSCGCRHVQSGSYLIANCSRRDI